MTIFRSIAEAFRFGCNHEWVLMTSHTLPSAFEQIKDALLEKGRPEEVDTLSLPVEFFEKTHITVIRCKKCPAVFSDVVRGPRK